MKHKLVDGVTVFAIREEASESFVRETELLVYYYEAGYYEGYGFAIGQCVDGTVYGSNLGHCSCYGPFESIHLETRYKTIEELKEKFQLNEKNNYYDYRNDVLKEFMKHYKKQKEI